MDNLDAAAPEFVICAAIRMDDGKLYRGNRHDDCILSAKKTLEWRFPEDWRKRLSGHEQGFITSRNRYVDRQEGMRLQLAAGVASVAEGGYRGMLFSEDLY